MHTNHTTHSILQRVPAILAVTAASYGLDHEPARPARHSASTHAGTVGDGLERRASAAQARSPGAAPRPH